MSDSTPRHDTAQETLDGQLDNATLELSAALSKVKRIVVEDHEGEVSKRVLDTLAGVAGETARIVEATEATHRHGLPYLRRIEDRAQHQRTVLALRHAAEASWHSMRLLNGAKTLMPNRQHNTQNGTNR